MKMQGNYLMNNKLLFFIVSLLFQKLISASDFEDGNKETKSKYSNQNQTQNLEENRTRSQSNPNQSKHYSNESVRTGNGALFGHSSPFPIMDSNGKVSVTPDYYSGLDHSSNPHYQPYNENDPQNHFIESKNYFSSENTPKFPSYLGKRIRGLPTHFDFDIKNHRDGKNVHDEYYVPISSRIVPHTDTIDQGPLSPAPKSPLEKAGWWEYLAILFGDSGDSTAVRLILHRLTKLAQLQLEGDEATKAQASTAFLAHHFKPLLVSSFQDFVYDPDYTRSSAMWSSDPGFSNIIRLLVDKMDFFGAQEELERIFGPNTSVAVSFGMRQPEWLRLKLIIEQIAWDMRHPNDMIGLWSSTWRLTVPQKLSIIAYASNPRSNMPLDLNLPNRDLIMARINLITNGETSSDPNLIKKESPLEQAHFKYAILQSNGNLCQSFRSDAKSINNSESQGENDTNTQESSPGPTSLEADGFKRRVGDYCELVNLTPNFNQFCQISPENSTPISSLLSASAPLFEEKVIKYVNHLERLFWAFTWVGAYQDAREALATLTNQLKFLAPKEYLVKKGKRVPTGVSESIQIRLEYMQAVHQSSQNNIQLVGSADVAYILSLMNYAHLPEAMSEWERRYSIVSARLQGYPGGPLLSRGEEQLLYQQARDVRIALLIYKYPRSVYVPCLSKGLLTRDPATDLTLLNLTLSLENHPGHRATTIDPLIPEMSARSLYLRALYLAGKDLDAARIARELAAISGNGNDGGLVNEFLACTELCGSATRNPCSAEKTYTKLLSNLDSVSESSTSSNGEQQIKDENSKTDKSANKKSSTAKTVYTVGKELSKRLCRLSRNTSADPLSLRYGKVLTTQATFSALKRYYDSMVNFNNNGGSLESKLKSGEAESILPWFGSLPPAPIDDILSFAPTHKVNFVPQVGIQGTPLINLSSQSNGSESSNSNANDKIFVLGKEYSANILTNSNGAGSSEPKTKLVNGIYQLDTNNSSNKGNGDENENENERGEQE